MHDVTTLQQHTDESVSYLGQSEDTARPTHPVSVVPTSQVAIPARMRPLHDYAHDLEQLASLALQPGSYDEVLSKALDALSDIIPYDLAAVYELQGEVLRVRAAEGPMADERIRNHAIHLSQFPTVRKALELRKPLLVGEQQHRSEEGDPYDGILDLPYGHACMVVPLFAGSQSLGLITLDRQVCVPYVDEMVTLAGVYGKVVSLSMMLGRQASLLTQYRRQLRDHNQLLRKEIGGDEVACHRVESNPSAAMRELCARAKQVAATNVPVLLYGETGSGKEVLAQALHAWSDRAERPFVKLNCAALPPDLVESELFGHVKGAFSGAVRDRRGRFLTANGGTLLLDEVGDLPLATQAKLLRVLQEGTFEPVGSDQTCRVNVRVIAATHVDLSAAMAEGRFREDLYYRLAVFPLFVPPLRQRREDVVPIAMRHLDDLHRRTGRGPWNISPAAQQRMTAHGWPGNVRELVNTIERATILRISGTIDEADLGLGPAMAQSPLPPQSPIDSTEGFPTYEAQQRRYFEQALTLTRGKLHGADGAASLVGLRPTTLQSKLKKLGIVARRWKLAAR